MPQSRYGSLHSRTNRLCCLAALALLTLPACRQKELRLWEPADAPAGRRYEVVCVQDILYYKGEDADGTRHRLDLFLPKGVSSCPVVMLVHGGVWMVGNNRCSGLYTSVGEFLAGQGVAVALPNYRLSPGVKHPEHVKDVARAFAWVHSHIAKFGGCPEQIFLAGHSAGGHLVALLASDERYLNEFGLRTADVKGVITFSGVCDIPERKLEVALGGDGPEAFRLDELLPFRGQWTSVSAYLPGIPLHVDVFGTAFGDDPKVRAEASPRKHVRPGLPPFLLLCAEKDLPALTGMAKDFDQALRKQGCDSRLVMVPGSNHNSIVFRAIEPDDPAAKAMLKFIREKTAVPPG
jgi:acetyl esterase/lipase